MEAIDKLIELRKMRKRTQGDIADCIGVSRSYMSQLESKRYNPSIKIVSSWCDALGCRLSITLTDLK